MHLHILRKGKVEPLEAMELYPASKMPFEVARVHKYLSGDVLELNWRWKMYDELYMKDENLNLLNESDSKMFGLVQNSLIDNILLLICRATDPYKSGAKGINESLTFDLLNTVLLTHSDSQLIGKFEKERDRLRIFVKEAKDARNKRIGHNDLPSIVANKSFPIKVDSLNEIIAGLGGLLNLVEDYFDDSPVHYQESSLKDDGNELLSRLAIARKHINRRTGTICCC